MERSNPGTTTNTDTLEEGSAALKQKLSAGDLGTIQEILFGEQWHADNDRLTSAFDQFNKRLALLEERTEQRLQQQLETLTATFDDRLKTLETQINAASDVHRTQVNEINKRVVSNNELVMLKVNDLSKGTNEQHDKIERQLQETANDLKTSLQSTHDDLNTKLGHAVTELKVNKIDRQSISKILGDAAKRIEDEHS